jgi:hypothetical protein
MGRAWRGASLLLIAAHGKSNGNGASKAMEMINGSIARGQQQLQLQWQRGKTNESI